MKLDTLKTENMRRPKRFRKGRGPGSGNGKLAGRGQNGYYSRSGNSQKRSFEGGQMSIWRRVPKRGFNNFRHATKYVILNVGDLASFPAGATIGWDELATAGFLSGRLGSRKYFGVKVLGEGEIGHPLTVHAHRFSAGARAKLEAAGCTLVELQGRYKTGKSEAEAATE